MNFKRHFYHVSHSHSSSNVIAGLLNKLHFSQKNVDKNVYSLKHVHTETIPSIFDMFALPVTSFTVHLMMLKCLNRLMWMKVVLSLKKMLLINGTLAGRFIYSFSLSIAFVRSQSQSLLHILLTYPYTRAKLFKRWYAWNQYRSIAFNKQCVISSIQNEHEIHKRYVYKSVREEQEWERDSGWITHLNR